MNLIHPFELARISRVDVAEHQVGTTAYLTIREKV